MGEEIGVYEPFGAAKVLFSCRAGEVLMEGPAGTGKTRAVLEKVHLCMLKYPGARGLIVRKTRASMTESVLVTFEEKVLGKDDPMKHKGGSRRLRQSYTYPNGSQLVVGGMDNAVRIMSTEYDVIAGFEATELTEDDWERLTTRLRNHVMPYQQAIADCNPESPGHWLNRRAGVGEEVRSMKLEVRSEEEGRRLGLRLTGGEAREGWLGGGVSVQAEGDGEEDSGHAHADESMPPEGERAGHAHEDESMPPGPEGEGGLMVRLRSRHEDNPTVTKEYLARLEGLSGVRRLRLKEGVWAASAGMVYDVFRAEKHVVEAKTILPGMVRWTVVGVDWGYRDAGVMQVWGVLGDGAMVRLAEHYHTGKTVSDWWVAKAVEFKRQYNPRAYVCDPSQPANIELLRKAGLPALGADNNVRTGIDRVYDRLDGRWGGETGRAGVTFVKGGLIQRDASLKEAKLATETIEEFESYVYASGKQGRNFKELPVDYANHGMDAMRYAVMYVEGVGGARERGGVKGYRGED